MSVTITIHGDDAKQALQELQTFAAGNTWRPFYELNTSERPATVKAGNAGAVAVKQDTAPSSDGPATSAPEKPEADGNGPTATNTASPSEVDSAGVPFDPELHTGTKKKDGTWRAKKGKADEAAALVEEVAEEPGNTDANGATEPDGITPTPELESAPVSQASSDEVDEFAAFKEAAAQAEEPVSVPERTWTDADLGQLCNDAAVKLGNPAPVKALITKYVPEGEVVHSRNIPNAEREAFAQEVEAAAGIEYAG